MEEVPDDRDRIIADLRLELEHRDLSRWIWPITAGVAVAIVLGSIHTFLLS